jgi:hypothetical protein
MHRILPFRKLLLVVVVVAAVLASVPQTAIAGVGNICRYYSDASYSQIVGARGSNCCGQSVDWGVVTGFSFCFAEYCASCP